MDLVWKDRTDLYTLSWQCSNHWAITTQQQPVSHIPLMFHLHANLTVHFSELEVLRRGRKKQEGQIATDAWKYTLITATESFINAKNHYYFIEA